MGDSADRVETTSRLAQWRIDSLAPCTYRKSDPFKIGMWNWYYFTTFFISSHVLFSVFKQDEPCSIWDDQIMQKTSDATALQSLGRMLVEHIHTDIMINAADGSIQAHRAVLAARSPVFSSMFSYNLKEKELSELKEACQRSLLKDVDSKNVLERLQNASLYELPELKMSF